MYIPSPLSDLIDAICLWGYWTLEITRLGLVEEDGVRAKWR
jgi:hypothetical protein